MARNKTSRVSFLMTEKKRFEDAIALMHGRNDVSFCNLPLGIFAGHHIHYLPVSRRTCFFFPHIFSHLVIACDTTYSVKMVQNAFSDFMWKKTVDCFSLRCTICSQMHQNTRKISIIYVLVIFFNCSCIENLTLVSPIFVPSQYE
jgi:hypothetical protein